jgi:hypothetical protein
LINGVLWTLFAGDRPDDDTVAGRSATAAGSTYVPKVHAQRLVFDDGLLRAKNNLLKKDSHTVGRR